MGMGVVPLTITPRDTSKIFASYFCDLMLYCPTGLSSKERNTSTRRHKYDSIQLKVKTAAWPL